VCALTVDAVSVCVAIRCCASVHCPAPTLRRAGRAPRASNRRRASACRPAGIVRSSVGHRCLQDAERRGLTSPRARRVDAGTRRLRDGDGAEARRARLCAALSPRARGRLAAAGLVDGDVLCVTAPLEDHAARVLAARLSRSVAKHGGTAALSAGLLPTGASTLCTWPPLIYDARRSSGLARGKLILAFLPARAAGQRGSVFEHGARALVSAPSRPGRDDGPAGALMACALNFTYLLRHVLKVTTFARPQFFM